MANLDVERNPQSGERRFEFASIQDYYDNAYYGGAVSREIPAHYRRLARRFQPWRGKKLLDVACGTGVWLRAAADLGAIPAGIDISPVALDVCKASLPTAELLCAPAERLPVTDGRFDFISCLGALEHFLALPFWPLSWQYQVYQLCTPKR